MKHRRTDRITFVGSAVVVFLCTNAVAQEGHYGLGHDKWHESFYSTLKRNDGGLCCNLMDCRPTQSRMIGDHYEVKVDGAWMPVPVAFAQALQELGWHDGRNIQIDYR